MAVRLVVAGCSRWNPQKDPYICENSGFADQVIPFLVAFPEQETNMCVLWFLGGTRLPQAVAWLKTERPDFFLAGRAEPFTFCSLALLH